MSASKLVRPSVEYKESFLTALREYQEEDRYHYWSHSALSSNFESYVEDLKTERGRPHQPYQEWVDPVPETILWFVKNQDYLGSVAIRHRLNWHLERWGGPIHFIIRPSMRSKGFGKKLLLKTIPIASYLGIGKALLTIAPDNHIAAHVIESCGGVFDNELPETEQFPARLRYWLDCA